MLICLMIMSHLYRCSCIMFMFHASMRVNMSHVPICVLMFPQPICAQTGRQTSDTVCKQHMAKTSESPQPPDGKEPPQLVPTSESPQPPDGKSPAGTAARRWRLSGKSPTQASKLKSALRTAGQSAADQRADASLSTHTRHVQFADVSSRAPKIEVGTGESKQPLRQGKSAASKIAQRAQKAPDPKAKADHKAKPDPKAKADPKAKGQRTVAKKTSETRSPRDEKRRLQMAFDRSLKPQGKSFEQGNVKKIQQELVPTTCKERSVVGAVPQGEW